MPPARKRRNVAEEDESEDEVPQTQRRRRAPASDDSDEDDPDAESMMEVDGDNNDEQNVKRCVRYVLACEFQRAPIRRAGIIEKAFLKRRVNFKRIFDLSQKQLRSKFGMQLVELPVKDKITIKEKKAAQKSKSGPKTSSSSYILTTILPIEYRTPTIMPPSKSGSTALEAEYIALCTIVVSLISLSSGHSLPSSRLETLLGRLNCDKNMGSVGSTQDVLARMQKQGYIHRSIEKNDADGDQIDFTVGPRGKVEIGNRGVMGVVKEVYGDDASEELSKKLQKSLGMEMQNVDRGELIENEGNENGASDPSTQRRKKQRQVADDD